MATISYIINAVDRASRTFNEVADSAARMGAVIEAATNRVENLGEQADRSAAKLAALTLSMEAVKAAAGGGGGGGGGGLVGKLFSSIPTSAASLVTLAAAIGLVVNALVDFASIIGPAVFGLGSFAAFAAPTVTSIFGGYTSITAAQTALANATTKNARKIAEANLDKAWKSLDPSQRGVVKGIMSVQKQFDNLSKQFAPDVVKLFQLAIPVVKLLLPDFAGIAKAAWPSIHSFFTRLATDAKSPQFQHFLHMMQVDAPNAIKTVGTWIFRIADWVIAAGRAIGRFKTDLDHWFRDTQHFLGNIQSWSAGVEVTVANFVAQVIIDFGKITHWFGELPGKIWHALASLPSSLKTIGIHAIEGLIGGITGMSGSLMSAVGNIVGGVLGQFGKLLGIKSPSTVMHAMGMNLMAGLANGMNAGAAAVNGFAAGHAASLAAAYSFGESGAPGGSRSGPDIAGLLGDIASLLADLCDITAGNPAETAAGITGVLAGRRRATGYRAMYGSQG